MENENYILYDTVENREYPPMSRKEAAGLVGCSAKNIYLAAQCGRRIWHRWGVTDMRNEEQDIISGQYFEDWFRKEWNVARMRLIGMAGR